jgi:quinol monooxygenase YgiN
MNTYFLHGSLKAKSGCGQELADILLEAASIVSKHPGCGMYLVSIDEKMPDNIWVTETWSSKEDHDDSPKNDEVRALIMKAMPIIDGQPSGGQQLKVLGGYVSK